MLILWIRKNKALKQNTEDKQKNQSFAEHNAAIKRFRLEHPDIAISSAKDILTEDGSLLSSIEAIKLWPNIQN